MLLSVGKRTHVQLKVALRNCTGTLLLCKRSVQMGITKQQIGNGQLMKSFNYPLVAIVPLMVLFDDESSAAEVLVSLPVKSTAANSVVTWRPVSMASSTQVTAEIVNEGAYVIATIIAARRATASDVPTMRPRY